MKSLVKNSMYMMVAQAVIAFSALVSSVIVAKTAGPDLAGKYGYIVWLGGTLMTIATLGVPNALTKFTAELKGKKKKTGIGRLNYHLMGLATIASLFVAVLIGLLNYFNLFPDNIPNYAIYAVAAMLPLNAIQYCVVGALRGHSLFNLILRWNAVYSTLLFAALMAVVWHRVDMAGLTAYYAASTVLNFLISLVFARKALAFKPSLMLAPFRGEVLKYIWIVSGIILLDQVVWDKSEAFFLGQYSTASQIAFYTIAFTLTRTAMTVLPGAILNAMLPRIAELQGINDMRAINDTFQNALKYVGIIVTGIAAGGIALASPFVLGIYGEAYKEMIPIFCVLLTSAAWATVVGVGSTVLYGMTKQTYLLKLTVWLAIGNIIMDLIIIPPYGAIGAAIANASVQGIGGFLTLLYLHKRVKLAFPVASYFKLLLCGVLAGGFVSAVHHFAGAHLGNIGSVILLGLAFGASYASLIFGFKLLTLQEVPLLNKLRKA